MTTVNTTPYLRSTRDFPEDLHHMSIEINKAYLDIANAVNQRVIGVFPVNKYVATGESYFITGFQKQQTFRRVFSFTTTNSIDHNIQIDLIYGISKCYGAYTDGTNWYGLIFGSNVAIAGQIGFYLTPTQIVFTIGAGAPSTVNLKGTLVVEWISDT
jgi:hypothetical protein